MILANVSVKQINIYGKKSSFDDSWKVKLYKKYSESFLILLKITKGEWLIFGKKCCGISKAKKTMNGIESLPQILIL